MEFLSRQMISRLCGKLMNTFFDIVVKGRSDGGRGGGSASETTAMVVREAVAVSVNETRVGYL